MSIEKIKNTYRELNKYYKEKITEPLSSIVFTVVGNLFPLWFGWIILKIFTAVPVLNPMFRDADLFLPKNFVVYSAAFLTSAAYLFLKQPKKNKTVFGLISITSLIIAILYVVTSIKNNIFNSVLEDNRISLYTLGVLIISFLLFVIFQIVDFRREHPQLNKDRKQSMSDLNSDFDDLKNDQHE